MIHDSAVLKSENIGNNRNLVVPKMLHLSMINDLGLVPFQLKHMQYG